MDENRQGQIALKLLKNHLRARGLPGADGFKHDLEKSSKEIGIDKEELRKFYEALLPEVLGDMLDRKKVTLNYGS